MQTTTMRRTLGDRTYTKYPVGLGRQHLRILLKVLLQILKMGGHSVLVILPMLLFRAQQETTIVELIVVRCIY